MALRLYQFEMDRLSALLAGRGNRAGKGIYPKRPKQVIITAEQVKQVKELLETETEVYKIEHKTRLSEWIIRGVRQGRYDWLVEQSKEK